VKEITEPQNLFLRLIGLAGHLKGSVIEADLRNHLACWRAAILTRPASARIEGTPVRLKNQINLIVLRDLPHGFVNLDSLFLLSEPGFQDQLEAMARIWQPDECTWLDQHESFHAMGVAGVRNTEWSGDQRRVILSLWWD